MPEKSPRTMVVSDRPRYPAIGPTGRSMFGSQCDSRKKSSEKFGFGREERFETTNTLFHSSRHMRVNIGVGSPGPMYRPKQYNSVGKQELSNTKNSPDYSFGIKTKGPRRQILDVPGPGTYQQGSSLGGQKSSRRHTSPSYGFGRGDRDTINNKSFMSDRHIRNTGGTAVLSPGAGSYLVTGSVGTQLLSPKRTGASWGWSQSGAKRLPESVSAKWAAKVPGPGAYDGALPAIGKQSTSLRNSEPAVGFGTSKRDTRGIKQFVSARHLRELIGEFSPGPGAVGTFSSIGKQPASKKKSLPAFGFAKSQRFVHKSSAVPGPGAYEN